MPEGPQVRQVANLIAKHVGEKITEIRHPVSRVPWDLPLPVKIRSVETKGKNIFIHLGNGQIIYNHLLMWGWWLPTLEYPGRKRLNTAFITNKGSFGYFGGGVLKLLDAEAAGKIRDKLGPDILRCESAAATFGGVSETKLHIGEALLSQELVSGIGNIYKSEGLFVAKINPQRRADEVSRVEYERLFKWLKMQMTADIKRSGKIMTTSREAAKAGHPNFVYRRWHQPCLICHTKIERIYQGKALKRSTYYCPRCQPIQKG